MAAAVLVLVGALLVCGSGAGAESGAGWSGAAAAAAPDGAGQGPGCGAPEDPGGLGPAVPPRSGSFCEPLPAPHAGRAAAGAWAVDAAIPDVRPEQGPPPLAAPSPVDLSILRV
ncbi:hypothetical protein QWM81_20750 [Streptomyces ficellus]|uniref:Uncharacterized protein n=1 Tax=Streptomyces ficellus TaxID=1977088 RepID=A0ABT7ZAH5_9ACTN|nr:hypothetical protein [Streptomyces ficellus]MDN3296440.1 hypothetical protein [Streptomyces ficellus]